MECEFPTINSNRKEIRKIFNITKTIAVIGLSPDESKASHSVAKYLQKQGFKIVPIYPKEETILGEKVYRSLLDVPFEIDMVDIFRKAKELDNVAEICIERGDIKVFWAQKGIVNNKAAARAKDAGMIVAQNMCTMVEHRNLHEEL
ncbi:MAG: CoA-binding protein [Sulfurimonas sp.]|uniref:CoA-binding protein n=1 Tax=Sulfurimonas sp. TaxID=2022749 RepID=UPI0025D0EBC8|nr:CoA-binding protein [Sulfurimonas sp.]MCK9453799.1 CoA-binding protein [Sulfurimonas sp.]